MCRFRKKSKNISCVFLLLFLLFKINLNKCSEFQIFVRSDLRFSWGFLLFLSELAARSLAASEVLYQLLLLLAYLIFSLNIWWKFAEIWWKFGENLMKIWTDLVCIVRFLNFVFDFVKNLVLSCSLRKKKIKICKKRSEIFFNENRDFFGFCDLISAKFWIFSSSSCRFWV